MIEYENLAGCFHLPVNQIEIFSWINENSEIILSGKYFLKGWKNKNCYFLTPVLIKQRCEIQLIPIPYNFLVGGIMDILKYLSGYIWDF